jgi:hypothetical protein
MARGSSWAGLPWDDLAVTVCVVTGLLGACRGEITANGSGEVVPVRTLTLGRLSLGAVVSIGMWGGEVLAKGEHVNSDHEVVTTGTGDLGGESIDSSIL